MKIKRKLRNVLILIVIIGTIVPILLIINNFAIFSKIYYKVNYKGDVPNFENIIEKSELFEYQKYCRDRNIWGEEAVYDPDEFSYYNHIDKEFIEFLKLKIHKKKQRFHLDPFYGRSFIYSSEVSNESLIYLTYNNNSIIKAEYANQTEIFTAEWDYYENRTKYWEGIYYINFSQIPYTPDLSSTIILNDIFLVKMNLDYHYGYWGNSKDLKIEQFLVFNSNFQIMFVSIPLSGYSIS